MEWIHSILFLENYKRESTQNGKMETTVSYNPYMKLFFNEAALILAKDLIFSSFSSSRYYYGETSTSA